MWVNEQKCLFDKDKMENIFAIFEQDTAVNDAK